MSYALRPIFRDQAFAFIDAHHRHHPAPQGWLFGTSAVDDTGTIVGVITVGRTVARENHDPYSAEVTRLCVMEGLPDWRVEGHASNVGSMLYAAAWRALRALGFRRCVTYLLKTESGVTLKALKDMGWRYVRDVEGRSWDCPGRRRRDRHAIEDRQLWEVRAGRICEEGQ